MNILMPQLGETVAEGTITSWYKAVGDAVQSGDTLFEIETDKTSMEVPATEAGVLTEIRTAAGVTVPVGSVVAILSAAGTAVAATKPAAGAGAQPVAAASATAALPAAAPYDPFNAVRSPERNFGPATLPNGAKVTPVARRLASQLGVDLAGTTGSGPHGRIIARDVESRAKPGATASASAVTAKSGATAPVPAGASTASVKALFADNPFTEVPLDGMRKTIAKRLLESKLTIPHFYLATEVALDKLNQVRTEMNAQSGGLFKLSINDFVIKALSRALQRVPDANAVWAEDRILKFTRVDIGVAVALEGGLITPIIRAAETKTIGAISGEMKQLATRAKAKGLTPSEYQGGTITISNLGMYGVGSFSAIVNPPQAAILAVGAAVRRPFEGADGSVRFGSFMTVTLSCDHRVIDGALGAQLLAAFKESLESPLALFA